MKKHYYIEDDEYEYEYETNSSEPAPIEFGCGFCWDKRGNKEKELFFLDAANNMRVCVFCPYCGRKFGGT